ncbi:MAG: SusC/RagA family TonB-linked outer membrane protein [Bacteroidales bacterium]|jgi:TonB-linked SusC/RagA family outer membrane protein|nr:SusC/RagA family TonB-linked outer membrane protein [Bacteroidales bacterium]
MGKKVFTILLSLLISVGAVFAQNLRVSGTIKESNGDPVSGAAVVLKGNTTIYTMTDALGNYKISVPRDGVLTITCMGYQPAEVPVNGRQVVDIMLKLDSEMLDETIVVAFGTSTKESFTGSAAVVGQDKLAQSSVSNITNALAGAVAGVQLTSSNGAPGSSATIRVRGFSSINAGKDPLIILDGAPYGGSITDLNPNDIESMTVLKDAASNALYGARGANGVIIITTKKAKAGEATVTFNAKVGVNTKALRQYRIIDDPALYYETHYDALYNYYINSGSSPLAAWKSANANIGGEMGNGGLGYIVYSVPQGQSFIGTNGKLNPAATLGVAEGDYYFQPDDWADYAYRKGLRQEYDLSVAGSNDRSTFYASMSYLNEEGITKASDLERLTGRIRADYKVKDWMKVGGNVSYTHYRANSLGNNGTSTSTGNIWAFTSQIAPIYPLWIRNADKSIKVDDNGIKMMDYGNGTYTGHARPFLSDANAIQDSELNTRLGEGNASTGNGFVDFNIIDGLTLTVNGTYNLTERRYTTVYNPYYGQFDTTGGTVEKEHDRWFDYNLQQLLNYKHTFAGVHNMAITLGHEYSKDRTYVLGASKSKMFSQSNKELSGAAVDGQGAYSYVTTYNNEGFFLRAQYDYDNKIFASASYRRDASSRFDPDYRWGDFWSAGAAWIISKEPWFNASWVDELKLKASIGSQGNDNIGNYRYVDLFNITNSSGNVATSFNAKGTRDITWETNTNFNVGTEFSFLNRISGSLEYFYRKTTDMLFSFSVAPSLGYPNYYDNVGDLYNQGIELDLNINILNQKNLRWDFNFNATTLKNRITMLDPDKKVSSLYTLDGKEYKGYNSGNFFITEKQAMYTWRLKEFAGVDQTTGESLWYKNTFDEDGKWTGKETTSDYSSADYFVTEKTSIPDVYGGFGTSVNAYGFDFSINFSYQLGGYQYDGTYASFMASPTANNTGYNFHADVLKSWTSDKPSKDIPRWQFNDIYSAGASTRFLTKSSYLNLENVNFGYTIPSKITKKIQIQSLRVFVAGQNMYYWSKRRGFDPRQSYDSSTNATNYSPMRTVSAGVTIKF